MAPLRPYPSFCSVMRASSAIGCKQSLVVSGAGLVSGDRLELDARLQRGAKKLNQAMFGSHSSRER